MDLQTIAQETEAFIKDRFSIGDDEDFTPDVNMFDYGFIDSLDATEIILFLEDKYKVEITQKDIVLYPMNTVNEIAKVVMKKI